ncbi:hypothetical protein O3Q52_20175 [Streptomyces sp. ActVer]|uniref:hypothetical protein n=1 Tax=Streptomyces sp. ActVer TaxID=3014558 RepID=UPI0022B519BE|nr:hypothetical protein [Streptomyces sp. ActVer]MCZ4510465.1 hypothetical protein [Streptomyces sp. ActVer]
MTTHTTASQLKPGDNITLCGRPEIVTRVEDAGTYIHVYVPDDPSDPYLLKPNEIVPIHAS